MHLRVSSRSQEASHLPVGFDLRGPLARSWVDLRESVLGRLKTHVKHGDGSRIESGLHHGSPWIS